MTDKTLGIIYAIKRSGKAWNQAVAEWMADYSGSPVEAYTEIILNKILKEAFIDYVSTCDRPDIEIYELLSCIDKNGSYSLGHCIAIVLELARVKNGDEFVNGFR